MRTRFKISRRAATIGVLLLSLIMVAPRLFKPPLPKIPEPYREELVIEKKGGGRHVFKVEIADTPQTLAQGLMFREHMDPDHGMLFKLGQTGIVSFWMKNTLIPLDMIFIAPDGTVARVHANAPPLSLDGISSEAPVSAVLEINGGRAKETGIAAGDRVIHSFFEMK